MSTTWYQDKEDDSAGWCTEFLEEGTGDPENWSQGPSVDNTVTSKSTGVGTLVTSRRALGLSGEYPGVLGSLRISLGGLGGVTKM